MLSSKGILKNNVKNLVIFLLVFHCPFCDWICNTPQVLFICAIIVKSCNTCVLSVKTTVYYICYCEISSPCVLWLYHS